MVEALKAKNLSFWEAYTAIDFDNNGLLSPAEFYGALVWLKVPGLTAEDVADFIEAADTNRDGLIDYREYMEMLSPRQDISSSSSSEEKKPRFRCYSWWQYRLYHQARRGRRKQYFRGKR